jgi:hypothetical protein
MGALGKFGRLVLGTSYKDRAIAINGLTTYAMASQNVGWCGRFLATDTRDVKTIYLNWSTVTAAGTVTVTVETIDATTGKPTGTLYDANATITTAPSAGVQALTFATPPTTGLTAGSLYAVVIITATAGTAHTLRSHGTNITGIPYLVMTAADGTTRSNFAAVAGSSPYMSLVFEDDVEEALGCAGNTVSFQIYGTRACGAKIVLAASLKVAGIECPYGERIGSPGDLRCRIFDSSDNLVTGASATIDKDYITASGQGLEFIFNAPVTLASGTYRVIFDQTDHGTSASNRYALYSTQYRVAALNPSSFTFTGTTNVDGSPISWGSDDATILPGIYLMVDDIPAPAAGGGLLINPGLSGGLR